MGIILASGSPRRQELLRLIGLDEFTVLPDTAEEEIVPGQTPGQTVSGIAFQKAKNVSLLCGEDDIIIAADTLVYLDGRPIAKPGSPHEAEDMLKSLSGRRHTVYTGVVILQGGIHITGVEKTEVFFRVISDEEIKAYVRTGEPMDKAGAYGVQGRGAIFVEKIIGDFFNIMGLPLCRLSLMLKNFGVHV